MRYAVYAVNAVCAIGAICYMTEDGAYHRISAISTAYLPTGKKTDFFTNFLVPGKGKEREFKNHHKSMFTKNYMSDVSGVRFSTIF
jgi:hypothetical protein